MSAIKKSIAGEPQLALLRKKRESLSRKIEKTIQLERDIAIASFLKRDKTYHVAENSQIELRRKLHIIRQNLQKKQLSIDCQERRLTETRKVHEEFVEAEKEKMAELQIVVEQIESIKSKYTKQIKIE